MMRKRTNRCRNTVWDISVISRNKNGETLCGDQCALEWADNDATVILSDGLGSGVKANILSTLTSTIVSTMLNEGASIAEVVETIAKTLPGAPPCWRLLISVRRVCSDEGSCSVNRPNIDRASSVKMTARPIRT